jgi:signal transduction histidine kinase
MNTAGQLKRKSSQLAPRYQSALNRYLKQGPDASVMPALKLGRLAVAAGLETLDLALIHEKALILRALPEDSPAARDRIIFRAALFFAQAILPLEETHRTALEANFHLSRLNRDLIRRTQHLAASSLLLKKEIARRLVVEENLRKSEVNTGRLLEQSRRFQEQLRFLSRRILSVQEEERKRISRELHDVIAQMLSGINVRLASLKLEASVNTKGLSRKITNAQRLVERSVDMVHRFARELRPAVLDDLGLIPALHSYMKGFSKETGLRVSITAFAGVEKLSNAKRTALYRVAQEALTNVARHARASKVGVTIQGLTNVIRMQITDDGKSFEVEQMWRVKKIQHLGLLGMRERVEMVGGKFSIESSPGHGTTVQVIIPFHKRVREQSRP